MFFIRQATSEDHRAIRVLVFHARINPLGLDWRRFLVAEEKDRNIIGCGQVRVYRNGSRELASIVVQEEWRRQGVASRLISSLKKQHGPPLWLTCRPDLIPFYEKNGFVEAPDWMSLPSHYRILFRLIRLSRWFRFPDPIIALMTWSDAEDRLR
jgi:N-acetylglutamate synthase-like GNAT family acetyltransferase